MDVKKHRRVIRKLSDLLPEIKIEAQGVDEITAMAALRRAYEALCMEHGFNEVFTGWKLTKNERHENGYWYIPMGADHVLNILSVKKWQHGRPHPVRYMMDDHDFLMIDEHDVPCEIERDDYPGLSLDIHMTTMPDVDGEYMDCETLTKWRHLVIAKTLEDLFSMENQPWSGNATQYSKTARMGRYQLYADRAARYLEDYLICEKHYGNCMGTVTAAIPPTQNVFW